MNLFKGLTLEAPTQNVPLTGVFKGFCRHADQVVKFQTFGVQSVQATLPEEGDPAAILESQTVRVSCLQVPSARLTLLTTGGTPEHPRLLAENGACPKARKCPFLT